MDIMKQTESYMDGSNNNQKNGKQGRTTMIKVIASDMDGTLLGNDHKVAPETLKAIHEACDAGIRFMIATGRNFKGAMEELKETDIVCDYIVGSGAEVRDQKQQIVSTAPLSMELCEEIYENLKEFPVSIIFSSGDYDYRSERKKKSKKVFETDPAVSHGYRSGYG